jgi:hypothetical protein
LETLDLLQYIDFSKMTSLFCYYSLRDFNIAFGLENMRPYYEDKRGKKNKLRQGRNIKGRLEFTNYYKKEKFTLNMYVLDLCGLQSGGLAMLASSVGLSKLDVLDDYKENIDRGLLDRPEAFLDYSI